MEANEGIESYELLLAVCREKGVELVVGYKQMRDLLEVPPPRTSERLTNLWYAILF